MGWEKFQITPGIWLSRRSMAAINSSLFLPKTGRHFSFGLRSTKYSVLKKPVESVPSSGTAGLTDDIGHFREAGELDAGRGW